MPKHAFLLLVCLGMSGAIAAMDTTQCSGKHNKAGQKQGVWICRDGKRVVKRERYKDGKLSSYIIYDPKGNIIETMDRKGKVRKFSGCGC